MRELPLPPRRARFLTQSHMALSNSARSLAFAGRFVEKDVRFETGDDETQAIAALGSEIGASSAFRDMPAMVAKALADGLSLKGAGEAVSIAASHLFLRWQTRKSGDVHHNVTANVQRYLQSQPELSLRTKVHALLAWATGPDVITWVSQLNELQPVAEHVAMLVRQPQASLLDDMEGLLLGLPAPEGQDSGTGGGDAEFDRLVTLAYQYASLGYDPQPLFRMLGKYVCRDESSEMHAYKHHQATYEEFYATRPELRWVHLVAAVKGAALSASPVRDVYDLYRASIEVSSN